jgi:phytanoyl-CoA hydroxylase
VTATTMDGMTMDGLTAGEKEQYERDGFVVREGLLMEAECDRFVEHMVELHAGRKRLEGFAVRTPGEANEWGRTHNQHVYDPLALEYLVLPQLRAPLRDCLGDEAEGIQTMYFWKGSEQRRHQDQFYLPGCMSAWLAFIDVSRANGTIWVQPGSHKQRLLTKSDFIEGAEFDGWDYNDAVDAQFERNIASGQVRDEIPVEVPRGSVVFFDGVLVHRGGPIEQPGTDRHVLANHYIPHGFDDWPHTGWTRHGFDGVARRHPEPQPA